MVRGLAYVLIFLPLTAVAAAPYSLVTQIWDGVTGPARLWRRLTHRKSAAPRKPAQGDASTAGALATPSNSARDWPLLEGARRR